METSQSPAHCRKGGPGCPPTSRLLQCHWRAETSTSSKVPTLGRVRKLRPERKGMLLKGGRPQFHSESVAREMLPGGSFGVD